MSEVLRITVSETEQFLLGKYGDGVTHVQQLGEGAWSYAYTFEKDGVKNIIRWGDVPDNFERDAIAYNAFRGDWKTAQFTADYSAKLLV